MTYHPYYITGENRRSPWLITCDHATNTVPHFIAGGTLGLSAVDMGRHIAFDPGAAGVALALAEALHAPCITSNFSRLVIDPNRGEDDPTLVMKLYDGTIIPANRYLSDADLNLRLNRCYRPYHTALAELAARRDDTIIVSVHSFTRQLRGQATRPWHVGVLYAADTRLTNPLIARLEAEPGICVGANEPYSGHLPGDAIARHAIAPQRPNALLELRNDLIEHADDQNQWANRLAPMLIEAAEKAGI